MSNTHTTTQLLLRAANWTNGWRGLGVSVSAKIQFDADRRHGAHNLLIGTGRAA